MRSRPSGKFSCRAAVGLAALAGGAPLLRPSGAPVAETSPVAAPAETRPYYDPFDPKVGLPPPPLTVAPAPAQSAKPASPPTASRWPPPLWPSGFQVVVSLALKTFPNGTGKNAYYRPYVAIWAEDENHTVVRTIALLGRDSSYLRHLTSWWRIAGVYLGNNDFSMTRATRPAGVHTFVWDGYGDNGDPLPKGRYTIFVEICRENGRHTLQTLPFLVGDSTTSVVLPADVESDTGKIEYGPPAAQPVPVRPAPQT